MKTEKYNEACAILALTEMAADTALERCVPSQGFIERARVIASRAHDLRSMAGAATDVGFQALPLPDYLISLASRAGVSLGRVLPSISTSDILSPWVTLAREIGVPLNRIRLLVRLFVADREAPQSHPMLARNFPGKAESVNFARTMDECELERQIEEIEATYSPATCRLLTATLSRLKT